MAVVDSDFDSKVVNTYSMHHIYNFLINNNTLCNIFRMKENFLTEKDIDNILSNKKIFNFQKIKSYKKFKNNNKYLLTFLEKYEKDERYVVLNSLIKIYKDTDEKTAQAKLRSIRDFYSKLDELQFPIVNVNKPSKYVFISMYESENFISDGKVLMSRVEETPIFNLDEDRFSSLDIQIKEPSFILSKDEEVDSYIKNEKYFCHSANIYTITPEVTPIYYLTRANLFKTRVDVLQKFVDEQNFKRFEQKYSELRKETIHVLKGFKSMNNLIKEYHYENLLENIDHLEIAEGKDYEKLLKRILSTNKLDKEMVEKPKQLLLSSNSNNKIV